MLLMLIVIVSGIFGAALQHYLPRMMTAQVPMETIYEEIPHVRAQLFEEADQLGKAVAVEAEIRRSRRASAKSTGIRIRPYLEHPPAEMFFAARAARCRRNFMRALDRIWKIFAKSSVN